MPAWHARNITRNSSGRQQCHSRTRQAVTPAAEHEGTTLKCIFAISCRAEPGRSRPSAASASKSSNKLLRRHPRKVFGFAAEASHATTLTRVLYEDVAVDFHIVRKVIGRSLCPESTRAKARTIQEAARSAFKIKRSFASASGVNENGAFDGAGSDWVGITEELRGCSALFVKQIVLSCSVHHCKYMKCSVLGLLPDKTNVLHIKQMMI